MSLNRNIYVLTAILSLADPANIVMPYLTILTIIKKNTRVSPLSYHIMGMWKIDIGQFSDVPDKKHKIS